MTKPRTKFMKWLRKQSWEMVPIFLWNNATTVQILNTQNDKQFYYYKVLGNLVCLLKLHVKN